MGKWLYAAYGLRIRELAREAENSVNVADVRELTKAALHLAQSAYAEGIQFAQAIYSGGSGDLSNMPKAKVLGPFVLALREAAAVRKVRLAARIVSVANPRHTDAQSEQISGEYERAVKRALHRLALDAGSAGIHAVADSIKGVA